MYVLSLKTALDCIFMLTYVSPFVWNVVSNLFPFIDPTNEVKKKFIKYYH